MSKILETENNLAAGILADDERVVWSGKPIPKRHLFPTGMDIYSFVFGIIWVAFIASFIMPMFIADFFPMEKPNGWLFTPFNIVLALFVGVGLFMLLLPLYRYWLAKRTFFLITNRRALIIADGVRRKINGFSNLSDVYTDLRKDGSGNLFFSQPRGATIFSGMPENIRKLGFVGLQNVAEVENHIRTLARN